MVEEPHTAMQTTKNVFVKLKVLEEKSFTFYFFLEIIPLLFSTRYGALLCNAFPYALRHVFVVWYDAECLFKRSQVEPGNK
jgi:hypothetical protein